MKKKQKLKMMLGKLRHPIVLLTANKKKRLSKCRM